MNPTEMTPTVPDAAAGWWIALAAVLAVAGIWWWWTAPHLSLAPSWIGSTYLPD